MFGLAIRFDTGERRSTFHSPRACAGYFGHPPGFLNNKDDGIIYSVPNALSSFI